VSKPFCLDTPVRNDLKADARTVDLRALNPNFFAFGALNLEIWPDDEELMDVLVEVGFHRVGNGVLIKGRVLKSEHEKLGIKHQIVL
jgi:hypothetical protein